MEEIETENFLNDNKDLTLISNDELRNFIQSRKPKSDWERFFKNKGLSEDVEVNIKEISILRNIVAHNKSFNQKQYIQMYKLLEKNEKEIDEAIIITEEEDFIKINEEKIQRTLRNFANSMKEIILTITNSLNSIHEKQSETLKEFGKTLSDITFSFNNIEVNDDK